MKNPQTNFTREELQEVANSYGLGRIQREPQLEREGSSNYNFKIITKNGSFNVRAQPKVLSDFHLKIRNLEYAVTDHLDGHDFYLDVPVFKRTLQGQRPFVQEGKTYDVYRRLPGETHDRTNVGREEIIEAVARYHKTIRNLPRVAMPARQAYDENGWLGQRLQAIKAGLGNLKTPFNESMARHIDNALGIYQALREGAKPNPVAVVVHGDINSGNLLYQQGILTGLIDFANVRWDNKENDLAKLTHGKPDQMARLVQKYREYNPLSDEEAANILPERLITILHSIRWLYEEVAGSQGSKIRLLDIYMKKLDETKQNWDLQRMGNP